MAKTIIAPSIHLSFYRPGDMLVARLKDRLPTVEQPHYFDHVAVVARETINSGNDNLTVVEASYHADCVIQVRLDSFVRRYPEVVIMRMPHRLRFGEGIGGYARKLIGKRYTALTPWYWYSPWKWNRYNCVSLVREAYSFGTGVDPQWTTPDDIVSSPFMYKVRHKKNYEGFAGDPTSLSGRIR